MTCIGFQNLIIVHNPHVAFLFFFCHSAEFHDNPLIFLLAKSSVLSIDFALASFSLNSNFGLDILEIIFH